MMEVEDAAQRELRVAARALARAGLVHAYGHCSLRLDDRQFLVNAAKPMGLLNADDPGQVVSVAGSLPEHLLGEVRLHQAIYRKRPNVNAICRVTPSAVTTLSAMGLTPRARHGLGAYFAPQPPLWPSPALVRDDQSAEQVADLLGPDAPAIVLRGNGAVAVGASLPQAVVLAWYLEDAARLELAIQQTPNTTGLELTPDEAGQRATWHGGLIERMWSHLTSGDQEQPDSGSQVTARNGGPRHG